MTGVAASGLLLACAAVTLVLCFGYLSWKPGAHRGWLRAALVTLAFLIPPAFLLGVVLTAHAQLGDVRLLLGAVDLHPQQLRPFAASIGGDKSNDTIVIPVANRAEPAIQAHALSIGIRGSGMTLTFYPPSPSATRLQGAGINAAGVVAAGDEMDDATILGSMAIVPGQAICIGGHAIVLDTDGSQFVTDRRAAALPLSRIETWSGRRFPIYPLRFFAAADAKAIGTGWLGRIDSFLYRRSSGLFVALLDRNAFVAAGADCARQGPPARVTLSVLAGQSVHLRFLAVQSAESWEVGNWLREVRPASYRDWLPFFFSKPQPPQSRLVDRRDMTIIRRAAGSGDVSISFDTPEAVTLSSRDLQAALSAPGLVLDERVHLSFGGLGMLRGGTKLDDVEFRAIGEAQRTTLVQQLEFDNDGGFLFPANSCGDHPKDVSLRHRFGEIICPGSTALSAHVTVEKIDLDWPPLTGLLFIPAAMALAGLLSSARWRFDSFHAFAVLAVADFLLIMRLLIAVEGAVIDPRTSNIGGVRAALVAIAIVPLLLSALQPLRAPTMRRQLTWLGVHGALALFCVALVAWQGSVPAWNFVVLAALGAVVVAAQLPAVARMAGAFWSQLLLYLRSKTTLPLFAVAGLLFALRALTPERFAVGGVSVVFMPAYLIFVSLVIFVRLIDVQRTPALRTPVAAAAAGGRWFVTATMLALPLLGTLAGDKGYAVTHAVPLLFWAALLAVWLPDLRLAGRIGLILPGAAVAAGILAAALLSSAEPQSLWPDPQSNAPQDVQTRIDIVKESVSSHWMQRLAVYFAPAKFSESGTSSAEGLSSALAQMQEYGAQGLWGRGYLNQPKPTELLRYHLDDNVAAIHLLTPFGRAGIALFAMFLLALGASCSWRVGDSRRGGAPSFLQSLGLLALWTLVWVSTYMILANLLVVPFTGRNVFLLSPISPTDLAEGVLLLGIGLYGLTREEAA